eukprot:3863753-Rhodomonas_salina.1
MQPLPEEPEEDKEKSKTEYLSRCDLLMHSTRAQHTRPALTTRVLLSGIRSSGGGAGRLCIAPHQACFHSC